MKTLLSCLFTLIFCSTLLAQEEHLIDSLVSYNPNGGGLTTKIYYQYDDQDRLVKVITQNGFKEILYISEFEIQELDYDDINPTKYTRKLVQKYDVNGNVLNGTYFVDVNGIDEIERVDTITYDTNNNVISYLANLVSDNVQKNFVRISNSYTGFNKVASTAETFFDTTTGTIINYRASKNIYNLNQQLEVQILRNSSFGALDTDSIFYTYNSDHEVVLELEKKYKGFALDLEECEERIYNRTAEKIELTTSLSANGTEFFPFQLLETYPTTAALITNDSIKKSTLTTESPELIQRRVFSVDDSDQQVILQTELIEFYTQNGAVNTFLEERYYSVSEVSAVKEKEDASLSLFPNPVYINQSVSISSSEFFDHVKLYSMDGQVVQDIRLTPSKSIQIAVSETTGIYLAEITSLGQRIAPIAKVMVVK